jgi:hypothetical protein
MDTTSRPQHYPTSVTEILERAERLSAGEIRALASAYRGESLAGQQDPNQRERGHKRARAVSIAISRSGRAAEAQALQEAISAAVRASAARERMRGGARKLGIVGDAELAVGDAALAALLADHLSKEVSLLLREPFDALEAVAPVPAAGGGR